jgi:AcrR family transcriptional regulator
MPRRSALDAQTTRDAIVARAAQIASMDGLEGVTIGRLASQLGMSKAGVLGHFGTKQALQLAAVREVTRQFQEMVISPALRSAAGVPRLLALCDNWIGYLADTGLPGGCLLTAAATEFDGRPGEVRELIAEAWSAWQQLLCAELACAVEHHQLRPDLDVDQALFELVALGPAVNQALQLHGDRNAAAHARRATRRVLGISS